VGAVCIAAAILDSKGYPVAALSISGINARLTLASRPAAARLIQAWCERIASALHAAGQGIDHAANRQPA
jgi:DNA-binding IclR family transcriptional regulator